MKSSDEWSTWIIAYMQSHPVTTLEAAVKQIKDIVEMVQKDSLAPAETDAPTIQ